MKQGIWLIIGILVIVLIFMFKYNPSKLQTYTSPAGAMSVVGVDCPAFKSNVVNKDYGAPGVWVAVDADSDGNYEGYGGTSSTCTTCAATSTVAISPVGNTPDGLPYAIQILSDYKRVFVYKTAPYTGPAEAWFWQTNVANSADLTCGSTAVCGNGVCESGETATSCPTDCSTPSCYVCASLDNVVSREELGIIISKWLSG